MHNLTKIIVAAAVTGAVGFSAISPVLAAGPGNGPNGNRPGQERGMHERGGVQGGLLAMVCSTDGAERLETALDRLAGRVELTDEQTALFDTFKSDALIAQTTYSDNCVAPVAQGEGQDIDLIERMQNRQANMTAYLEAVEGVMPSLEAFFNSLTDEQKADLRPDFGGRGGQGGQGNHADRRGPGGPGGFGGQGGQGGPGFGGQGNGPANNS